MPNMFTSILQAYYDVIRLFSFFPVTRRYCVVTDIFPHHRKSRKYVRSGRSSLFETRPMRVNDLQWNIFTLRHIHVFNACLFDVKPGFRRSNSHGFEQKECVLAYIWSPNRGLRRQTAQWLVQNFPTTVIIKTTIGSSISMISAYQTQTKKYNDQSHFSVKVLPPFQNFTLNLSFGY